MKMTIVKKKYTTEESISTSEAKSAKINLQKGKFGGAF